MLSHRIAPLGAVLLAVTIGSAAAQDQTSGQTSVGKPLQLLQFARHGVKHEAKAPLHPHARAVEELAKPVENKPHIAKKTGAKHPTMFAAIHHRRFAEAAPAPAPAEAQPNPVAPQPPVWPGVDAAATGSIAVPVPAAAEQNVKTEPVVSDAPDAIVADGQVAQASPPPEGNAAAADPHPAAAEPAPAKIAAAEPVVRAMVVAPVAADSGGKNPIGSAPWLMQVLAALGGALAAGAVAWFLILRSRSEPRDEEFFAEAPAPGE